jgi:hypothetical protein
MKKCLITGAMALLAGFYLTSCTHDDIKYSSLYEEKTQTYDKVFKELYGTIDPNHDWGFKALGSAYSGTRALTNGESSQGDGETTTSKKYKADQHKLLAKGRVFVENLSNASREYLDFNDAVFDAIVWEVTHGTVTIEKAGTKSFERDLTIAAKDSVEICLLAAGGTVPLIIAGDKFGKVHDVFANANPALGISGATMVNTRGYYSEASGSYVNGVTPVYGKFDYTEELANKKPENITLNDIKVAVFWKSGDYTAATILNNGETQFDEAGKIIKQEAPHMLCAPIGTRWATECKNIMDGYPGFKSYVNNSSNSNVWESATDNSSFNLYEENPSPLKYGTMDEGDVYYDNMEEISNYEGTVLWEGSSDVSLQELINLANTDAINPNGGGKLRVYLEHTGSSGQLTVISPDGWSVVYLDYNTSIPYGENKDIVLNANMSQRLIADKQIKLGGQQLIVKAITYIAPSN